MKKLPVDYSPHYYIDDDGDHHTLTGRTEDTGRDTISIFMMTYCNGSYFLFDGYGREVCENDLLRLTLSEAKDEE